MTFNFDIENLFLLLTDSNSTKMAERNQRVPDFEYLDVMPRSDLIGQNTPPSNIFKLHADCCENRFEYLSLDDIHALGN